MIDDAKLVEYNISYHWLEVEIFHVEDAAMVARFEKRPRAAPAGFCHSPGEYSPSSALSRS
jgi:hypothetical protein